MEIKWKYRLVEAHSHQAKLEAKMSFDVCRFQIHFQASTPMLTQTFGAHIVSADTLRKLM